jgi:ribosomal protein L39E
MATHKSFRTKRNLAKRTSENRPMPQFLRKMTRVRHVANPERRRKLARPLLRHVIPGQNDGSSASALCCHFLIQISDFL